MSSRARATVALAALLLGAPGAGGCGGAEENGPGMSPGEDCLGCHNPAGSASGHWFGAAGTVFDGAGNPAAGVAVNLVDSRARQVDDVTNWAGNFYFAQELTPPLQVSVVGPAGDRTMADATGACNSCHQPGGTPGPIVFP
ncbi:MAG: hypothetical protein HY906_12715 [Deltaproteobacteria bacterium]|nr:hypothetical protein [Deltaproteobacteria bacterium]